MHRGSLVLLALAVVMCAGPRSARAVTQKQAQDFFAARHKGCTVNLTPGPTGTVNGFGRPVTAVTVTLDNCAGGTTSSSELVLLYDNGSRVGLIEARPPTGPVENVRLVGDRIVATTLEYAPTDPRCCPSRKGNHQFVVSGGKLVQVR